MSDHKIGGRDWRTDLDMDDPRFGDLFNEINDDYVAHCPVARSEVGRGYYMVARYADNMALLKDWEHFSNALGNQSANQDPNRVLFKPNESDPPQHSELRRAINRFFTAKAVSEHEDEIRGIADGLLDKALAADSSQIEAVSAYADPLPPIAFCQAVGHMPAEDMSMLQKAFTMAIVGPVEERAAYWLEGQRYMLGLIEKRRSEPRVDDFVNSVIEFEYSDGTPYSDEDRGGSLAHITAAGSITTGAIISGSLYHLATTPADLAKVREDRSLIPSLIEEILRYYTSAPCAGRKVVKDVELGGTQFRASRTDDPFDGDFVAYNLAAANRDPEVFESPDEVDIERSPNPHIAFAAGVHRCVGLHLARLELRIAVEAFLDRFSKFELPDGFEPHFQGGITRHLVAVPLNVETAD
jgi:cytochrome P450